MKKRWLCFVLAVILCLGLLPTAAAAASAVRTFSDVTPDKWYYDAVTEMVSQGLLQGTQAPDENGVGFFGADGKMDKAGFITIAVRAAFPEELANAPAGDDWYSGAYDIAYNHALITVGDPQMTKTQQDMQALISREEMAMIVVRTAHAMGISAETLIYASQIPDYDEIDDYYSFYVRESYTLGLLNGTGNGFEPLDYLDRASASQCFYKLLDPDARTPLALGTPETRTYANGLFSETEGGMRVYYDGYASENGMLYEQYSRHFETLALSACRFGIDETGVYVDLVAPKLPDALAGHSYMYSIGGYTDRSEHSALEFKDVDHPNHSVTSVPQGETQRFSLSDRTNGDKILTSLDEIESPHLCVEIFSPDGKYYLFSRTIWADNKSVAVGRALHADNEVTPLDATAVWAGVGK